MIPFSPPRIDDKIIEEVVDTLRTGWISTGPKTRELEALLCEYNQVESTLCVGSGSAGMELILRWFGVGPGDEVIIPAYTYCATANVVMHCGAKPVMVDVNACDFNISAEKIANAITPKTKVILPVDIGGLPCDYDRIYEVLNLMYKPEWWKPTNEVQKILGRPLIMSDAAHSLGAKSKGIRTGKLADVTVFSFHAVKNLTTGEGGAIAFNLPLPFDNKDIRQKLGVLSLHGQSKDALEKFKAGSWEYDVNYAGYKCNMPDILASIGLVEIKRYESDTLRRRKDIFLLYLSELKDIKNVQLPFCYIDGRESNFHLFLLRLKEISEGQRNQIIQKLSDKGIAANVHFKPLPLLSFYKNKGYKMSDYPISYDNYKREISLPLFYNLTDEQVVSVCNALKASIKEVLG